MLILVTGATGKVGRHFIARFLADERFAAARVRALCHNRLLEPSDRIEVVRGSIADRADVDAAMDGVTHVLHLATCKETPDDVMDVTVKGLFWLLEAFRTSHGRAAVHPDRRRRRRSAISSTITAAPSPRRRRTAPIRAATRSRRCSKR